MLSQIEICEVQFEVGLESSKYVANVETIQFNSQPNFDWTASWDSLDSISGSFRKFCHASTRGTRIVRTYGTRMIYSILQYENFIKIDL